jgi:hypothetical protein
MKRFNELKFDAPLHGSIRRGLVLLANVVEKASNQTTWCDVSIRRSNLSEEKTA